MKRLLKKSMLTAITLVAAMLMGPLNSRPVLADPPSEDFSIILFDVLLRPGVTADIHLRVFVNEQARSKSLKKTILAVHGTSGNCADFAPFAEAIFNDNPLGPDVKRVVAIDMPGHGLSGLPTGGLLFGELSLDDYVTAIIAALDRLPDFNIRPKSLIGWSMGGLLVQMTQQRLVDDGTNLRRAFGIKQAVIVTPTPPAGISWPLAVFSQDVASAFEFCFSGPGVPSFCGGFFPDVDGDGDVDWTDFGFIIFPAVVIHDCDPLTTPLGLFSDLPAPPNTGAPFEVVCDDSTGLGDVSAASAAALAIGRIESSKVSSEQTGTFGYARKTVDQGIFGEASGTRLGLIEAENDMTLGINLGAGLLEPDMVSLYIHLTGNANLKGYTKFDTGLANGHLVPVLNPALMIDFMAEETNIMLP